MNVNDGLDATHLTSHGGIKFGRSLTEILNCILRGPCWQ